MSYTPSNFCFFFPVLLTLLLFPGDNQASPPIVINEFLSSNHENITDEDGDAEDWIELYHQGEEPVSLYGFGLTDREGDYFRWVFPDTTIMPGSYMIIWASGKDRRTAGKPLHTNFSIAATGEPLRLSDFNGNLLDTVPPVRLPTDYSYGRQPDGSNNWHFFTDPTPGAPNTTDGEKNLLFAPDFSHEAGFYANPFYLSLSPPDGLGHADIYFTTDGSTPGPYNGTLYTQPVPIVNRTSEPNDISMIPTNNYDSNHPYGEDWKEPVGQVFKANVIRAITHIPGRESIETATHTYIIDRQQKSDTPFPTVSLATHRDHFFSGDNGIYVNDNFWNSGEEWERPVHIEFFEGDRRRVLSQNAGVRIHGGTSRGRPVKSLRLYARRSYGTTWFDYPFLPDAPVNRYKRFLLRNSGNDWDGTYFRDALMQHLIAHTSVETQYYRPVKLFLNGEYWGIHNFRKRYDHRYFETMYSLDREDLALLELNAEVKEGTEEDRQDFFQLRNKLDQHDVNNHNVWDAVTRQMDIENFRDYQISNIYFRNTDWPSNNIDFWRKRTNGPVDDAPKGHDGRWRWLLYDTDFGFNLSFNYVQGYREGAQHNTLRFAIEGSHHHWPNPQWSVKMLRGALRNHSFQRDFILRFADLLNSAFSEERVIQEIDVMYNNLKPYMQEHINRWRGPENIFRWEQEVESMRTFGRERPSAVRNHIISQFNLSGTVDINLNVNNPDGGYISIHSIDIKKGEPGIPDKPWPWKGVYFKDIPVTIKAHTKEGYTFNGWIGHDSDHPEITLRTSEDIVNLEALFKATETSAGDKNREGALPELFNVAPAYPNPFNSTSRIRVALPEEDYLRLTVYTVTGRNLGVFYDGKAERGYHDLILDAGTWSSGIYIAVVETGTHQKAIPLTLIK